MKKTALILLCIVITCSLWIVANAETSGDYIFSVHLDGTAEINEYTGSASDLIIPSELNGHPVTSIGDYAFNRSRSLKSITISECITSIGANPFTECARLASIKVSQDHPVLATIDGVLFSKTDKRLICYPKAYTSAEYVIPQGIQIIGDCAFGSCDNLKSIIIPDSVTSIGDSAFYDCSSLTSITIPDSVINIGINPFSNCPSLISIKVSPDHPAFATIDGVLFSKNDKRLICYPKASTFEAYVIPYGIKAIGDYSFEQCDNLMSVSIPDSVTTIGEAAFNTCSNLTSIAIPDSVKSIGEDAFWGCSNLTITVTRDSYAAQYCKENDLTYTYTDSLD